MRSLLVSATALVVLVAGSVAHAGDALPTCEDAAKSYIEDANAPVAQRDLTKSDYAEILDNGSYLDPCSVPGDMAVKICAAVQDGKAVGLTISTSPSDPTVEACVKDQVAALEFPSHPKMDIARTTFAPEPKDETGPRVSSTPGAEPPPPVAPKKSGCGCAVPRESSTPIGALLLLGALLGRRAFGRR